jgi:hypothetical protein
MLGLTLLELSLQSDQEINWKGSLFLVRCIDEVARKVERNGGLPVDLQTCFRENYISCSGLKTYEPQYSTDLWSWSSNDHQ